MTKLLDLFGKSPYPPKGEPWRTDIRPPAPEGNAVRIPPLGDRGIFRRSLFFTFLISCSLLPYGGKTFAQEHDFTERIKHLETAFSEKDYNAFFGNFPNGFHELNSIYGYTEKAMPLYYAANEHIDYLFAHKNKIDGNLFVAKLCNIAINGKWEADGIGYFQHHLVDFILSEPKTVVKILNDKTDKEIESFWRFVMDGPVPQKELFKLLYPKVSEIDRKHARIIKKEHQKTENAYKNEHR